MKAVSRTNHRRLFLAVIAAVFAWGAHIFLRRNFDPGEPIRLAVTAVVVLCFFWVILEQFRFLRSQDEFVRQVQYLALSIAFPSSLILLFAFGFFRAEGVPFLQGGDPRDLVFIPLAVYGIGLTIALKHYE